MLTVLSSCLDDLSRNPIPYLRKFNYCLNCVGQVTDEHRPKMSSSPAKYWHERKDICQAGEFLGLRDELRSPVIPNTDGTYREEAVSRSKHDARAKDGDVWTVR